MNDETYRLLIRACMAPLVENIPEGPDWDDLADTEIAAIVPAGRRAPGWLVGFGAAAVVMLLIGVAVVWAPSDPTSTTAGLSTFQTFDVDTAAAEVEAWWSLVIAGDLSAAAEMAHPDSSFNFGGLREMVSRLGVDVTVNVARDVFGAEDLPMLCYTLTGNLGEATGAAVFRDHEQTWLLWEVRPNTVGCLDTTTTISPTTTVPGSLG